MLNIYSQSMLMDGFGLEHQTNVFQQLMNTMTKLTGASGESKCILDDEKNYEINYCQINLENGINNRK